MARGQALEPGGRALGLAGLRKPRPKSAAHLLAVPLRLEAGQRGRPGPARHDQGLCRGQRRQPGATLGKEVIEVEPEALALGPLAAAGRFDLQGRIVGRALEDDMDGVPGRHEAAVQPPRGNIDEPIELPGAHHRPRAVDPEQADQRSVPAQETAVEGGGREHETLQRFPPDRPGQAEYVFENPVHGQSFGRSMVCWPETPAVSVSAVMMDGVAIRATPTISAMTALPNGGLLRLVDIALEFQECEADDQNTDDIEPDLDELGDRLEVRRGVFRHLAKRDGDSLIQNARDGADCRENANRQADSVGRKSDHAFLLCSCDLQDGDAKAHLNRLDHIDDVPAGEAAEHVGERPAGRGAGLAVGGRAQKKGAAEERE